MPKDIGYLGGRELRKELGVEQHSEDRKTLGVIGRVGVGTTTYTPDFTMEVRGDFKPKELIDSVDSPGTSGLYLSKDINGIRWVQPEPTSLGAIFVTEDDQIIGVSSFVGINFRGGDFVSISTNTFNTSFVDINFAESDSIEWVEYSTVGIFTTKFVGIGTTQPTTHLEVQGNGFFSGVVTATTFIGDLTGNATGLSGTPNLNVGVIAATNFVGDGSGLTNITATGSGIGIRDDDSPIGTAQTINFGTNLTVTPASAGIVTITAIGGNTGAAGTWAGTSAGIHTTKNVGVGTTNPQSTFQVERYGVQTGFGTFTAIAGVAHTVDSYDITVTDFKTSEYTLFFEYNNNIQSEKIIIMQNGTSAFAQEYAIMSDPSLIISATGTLSGNNINLEITPETGVNGVTTYRFVRQSLL